MKKFYVAAALMIGAAMPAIADEAWSTEIGEVIYDHETDQGHAVLTYPIEGSEVRGIAYVDDLAGQYEGRTAYTGVWIEPDDSGSETCAYAITDPETGEPRRTWGQFEMVFTEPDYPSGWVIKRGYCFEAPVEFLVGKPIRGE